MLRFCFVFFVLRAVTGESEPIVEDEDFDKPEQELSLTSEDFEKAAEFVRRGITGLKPATGNFSEDKDPIEQANQFEGDIAGVDNITIESIINEGKGLIQGNAIRSKYAVWPNGVVPYTISSYFGANGRAVIASAMQVYHAKTCIRFRARSTEKDYIYIYPNGGCHSRVGRVGGRQIVSLGQNCVHKGTIIHELMHAVGFWHEQSRADRDQYVRINKHNVMPGQLYNFESYGLNKISHLGTAYDYGSIMHYGPWAFSKNEQGNGSETIIAKCPGGQRLMKDGGRYFSKADVYKLNKVYRCHKLIDERDIEEEDDANCGDKKEDCKVREFLGYCDYDLETKDGCRKTCELCGWGGSFDTGSGDRRTRPTTRSTRRPRPSTPTTRGSTTGGGSSVGSCVDRAKGCIGWERSGDCNTVPVVREYCPKSCGLCAGSPRTTTATRTTPTTTTAATTTSDSDRPTLTCKDKILHCKTFLSTKPSTFCADNPKPMKEHCAETCKYCSV